MPIGPNLSDFVGQLQDLAVQSGFLKLWRKLLNDGTIEPNITFRFGFECVAI